MHFSAVLFLLFVGIVTEIGLVAADSSDDTEVSAPTDRVSFSTDHFPTVDASTLTNVAVSAAAAALGVAGLAIIVIFVLHMLGIKKCHLLGTCDALAAATAHFAGPQLTSGVPQGPYQLDNSPYAAYAVQQQNTPATNYQHEGNSFSKRSVDFVGPVLRSLASAYDKYGN